MNRITLKLSAIGIFGAALFTTSTYAAGAKCESGTVIQTDQCSELIGMDTYVNYGASAGRDLSSAVISADSFELHLEVTEHQSRAAAQKIFSRCMKDMEAAANACNAPEAAARARFFTSANWQKVYKSGMPSPSAGSSEKMAARRLRGAIPD